MSSDIIIGNPIELYIKQQYLDILKREADSFGIEYYKNEINMNRIKQYDLPNILRSSAEYKKLKITELYKELIGVEPGKDIDRFINNSMFNLNNIKKQIIMSDNYFRTFLRLNMPLNNFKISEKDKTKFIDEYIKGFEEMKKKNIIITGLLRDKKYIIPHMKNILTQIGKYFNDYRIIIVENDSVDGTREELEKWCKEDYHVIILGNKMNLPKTIIHNGNNIRISKMANLRNIYLDYIEKHYSHYDYVIVNDLDINGWPYIEGIASSIYHMMNENIDMISCNGCCYGNDRDPDHSYDKNYINYRVYYYDTFPYIINGMKYIWNNEFEKLQHDRIAQKYTINRYKLGGPLEKVISAFCGLTIYRIKSLKGKKYGFVQGKVTCEHNILNVQLKNCFINPSMIYFILEFV
jgi:hypothetical protein